jgi:hypothetical protein
MTRSELARYGTHSHKNNMQKEDRPKRGRSAKRRQEEDDSEGEEPVREAVDSSGGKKSKKKSQHPSSFQVGDSRGSTDMSSIHPDESVTNTLDQERWRMMEERIRNMEDKVKEVGSCAGGTVVSGESVTPPPNERILKENLRKFVAAKVFPKWKFIFKINKLRSCVISAIGKSYITVPPGFDENQLAELYASTVRASLDGCRANAQTTARKRYLGKEENG